MCGMRDGFDEKEQRRDQRGRQETRSAITDRQHTPNETHCIVSSSCFDPSTCCRIQVIFLGSVDIVY